MAGMRDRVVHALECISIQWDALKGSFVRVKNPAQKMPRETEGWELSYSAQSPNDCTESRDMRRAALVYGNAAGLLITSSSKLILLQFILLIGCGAFNHKIKQAL